MKNKTVMATILLTTSILTTLFTGCSSNVGTNNSKKQIVFFSNKIEAVDTYNKLVEKFEDENPDIDVIVSAPPDATTVLKTRLVKGDAPDIISLSADRTFADFVDANILEDLSGKIDFDVIDPVYSQMLKDLELEKVEGKFGVPYALNASGVIYNKNIFEKLNLSIPNTWDEFINVAKIVKDNGITPFYFTLKDSWTSLPPWNTIASTLVSSDSFQRVNNLEITFNELYDETTDKIIQLMDYGHSDNFGVGYNDGNTAFAQGKTAMYLQGSYAIAPILTVNPNLKLGMFPLPASNNEEENKLVSGVDVYFAIPKDSKNKEESIRFINFLLREENAKTYIDEQCAFSAVKGVKQEDSKFEAFDEFFKNSRVVDFQDHFYPAELPAGDMVQTYLLDGDKDKFLNNFQKEWLKANRQYIKK
ncbi:extracellular solute-binding protein [Clostridium sp. D53t1_180928_C8]|uniref:ABC transporter substrate-binding protein n=1 Tax=Clostridium sp. D53t1_180928_C8 TaxID=2787101 RepID=UPI0018ABF0B3|nr:extracellular solute-binding protein [Clostridium sp. D53t1_180928_C8]